MENERVSQADTAEPVGVEHRMKRLVLASSSPRRAEILRSVGWDFRIQSVDIDESHSPGEAAVEYVERLAREKAEAAAPLKRDSLVLGADTTVVVDGDILAKPRDEDDARTMLRRLSGRWHEVLTGVALIYKGEPQLEDGNPSRGEYVGASSPCLLAHESTRVLFAALSDEEINWYVSTGEPMGKAGAYAIQGRAALFIEEIEGDYWNVVGLPVRLVYKMTREISRAIV